jgi:uncharacterized membrane protein
MAEVWTTSTPTTDVPGLRRIGFGELAIALRRGWADFLSAPTQLVFLGVLYPLIGLLAATLAAGRDVMHLLFPMAAGFALVGPIAALGLYEISRQREHGKAVSWRTAFEVLRAPAIGEILVLAVGLLVIFLAWLVAADAIFAATVGKVPADLAGWRALLGKPAGMRLLLVGNAVGFVFAAAVLVLTTLSFPMLLDRDGGVARAVATSARAFVVNPLPMLAWGLIVAALLLLGSIPLFIGLAVVVPVLGHATWHLYRLVVA